ncbi:hypothetical protein NL676_035975 [Syzygium grande]|nr:hypothetical protein NL676_035975 [Syzygium grande]
MWDGTIRAASNRLDSISWRVACVVFLGSVGPVLGRRGGGNFGEINVAESRHFTPRSTSATSALPQRALASLRSPLFRPDVVVVGVENRGGGGTALRRADVASYGSKEQQLVGPTLIPKG